MLSLGTLFKLRQFFLINFDDWLLLQLLRNNRARWLSKFWWVLGLPFTIMTQRSSPATRTIILNISLSISFLFTARAGRWMRCAEEICIYKVSISSWEKQTAGWLSHPWLVVTTWFTSHSNTSFHNQLYCQSPSQTFRRLWSCYQDIFFKDLGRKEWYNSIQPTLLPFIQSVGLYKKCSLF